MSRSYKKSPICKDGSQNYRKAMKRYANKKVRYAKNVPNGKQYRKFFESWDIYDHVSRGNLEEFISSWEKDSWLFPKYETLTEAVHAWKTWYFYK